MRNYKNTLRLEKDKNSVGVRVDWPYPHADRDTAEDFSTEFYWIS